MPSVSSRSCMFGSLALLALGACGTSEPRREPRPAPAPIVEPPPPAPSFTVHEWGLFGHDIASGQPVVAASSTSGLDPASGSRAHGDAPRGRELLVRPPSVGKPVIYVHLDEGFDEASLAIALALPGSLVPEHFPPARLDATHLEFGPIIARRGRCDGPTPAPLPTSPTCTTVGDQFCEAAEIPRYHGDDDTCLTVGSSQSELLFYRALGRPAVLLPMTLVRTGRTYATRIDGGSILEGPVVFVERDPRGRVRYRALTRAEQNGPIPAGGTHDDAAAVRALLLAHARTLGLTEAEADAFIDAWSPAFFDRCHRTGPEASGEAPAVLGVAEVSLLYFAPRSVVDTMLPMTVTPPARETNRAFLVRVIDSSRTR